LRTKCLDKDMCGLLLKGSKSSPNYVKDAMLKLISEHPQKNIAFAAVDTSVLYLKNLEEYLPELQSGQPRFVMFSKVSGAAGGGEKKGGERLKTSIAALPTSGVSYGQMSNLVASVVSGTQDMTKLTMLPTVNTRTKKLEEEERAKRARKMEQQRRSQSGSSSGDGGGGGGADSTSSGGHFSGSANDGSKEGRKMEREKRRKEHMKNNPNYKAKTPEEIAEMERQRRKRMEEEADKWNMAPEDMPNEGAPVDGDDESGDYNMDDYYDIEVEEGEDNDNDDEDILDLD
jgi:hypothetical protein